MSDRICIASGGKLQVEVSAEDLLTCCSGCGSGCNGGFPSAAWSYYKSHGLVSGGLWNSHLGCQPYAIPACEHHTTGNRPPCSDILPTPRCTKRCIDGYNRTYSQDKHYATRAYTVLSNEKQIMKEISTNGQCDSKIKWKLTKTIFFSSQAQLKLISPCTPTLCSTNRASTSDTRVKHWVAMRFAFSAGA